MDITTFFLQFGVAGGVLFVFYMLMKQIVAHFIRAIESKDRLAQEMANEFTKMVNNHLVNNTAAIERNTVVLNGLAQFCDRNKSRS